MLIETRFLLGLWDILILREYRAEQSCSCIKEANGSRELGCVVFGTCAKSRSTDKKDKGCLLAEGFGNVDFLCDPEILVFVRSQENNKLALGNIIKLKL